MPSWRWGLWRRLLAFCHPSFLGWSLDELASLCSENIADSCTRTSFPFLSRRFFGLLLCSHSICPRTIALWCSLIMWFGSDLRKRCEGRTVFHLPSCLPTLSWELSCNAQAFSHTQASRRMCAWFPADLHCFESYQLPIKRCPLFWSPKGDLSWNECEPLRN